MGNASKKNVFKFASIVTSVLILALGLLGFSWNFGKWDKKAPKEYICQYTEEKVAIDGVFDEPCWQKAKKITFYRLERWVTKQPHRKAISKTTARLLWDKDYLYIAMEAEDKDIWATIEEHDAVLCREDVLEIFLKPRKSKCSYYEFEISPKNVTWDIFYSSRGVSDNDKHCTAYESNLKSATKVYGTLNNWKDEDGKWTLEVAIPFSSLKDTIDRTPQNGEQWRFALCRYDFSSYLEDVELSSSACLGQRWFHLYEDYDILKFQR
ncbi:carbohydrate-binding family 9-like protein [bacterium]|nr:carbohydrate-binding family 9-like protein [bacterium]